MRNLKFPRLILLCAIGIEIVGTMPLFVDEIRRVGSEFYSSNLSCYFLLASIAGLMIALILIRMPHLGGKVLSILLQSSAAIFNLFFFVDGHEKRRAVIFMESQESLSHYYEYWERLRFSEYVICLALCLIIISLCLNLFVPSVVKE